MRFLDGSAFFRHHFIKLGWLETWKALIPQALQRPVFEELEAALNTYALEQGELRLEVPMLYLEAVAAL